MLTAGWRGALILLVSATAACSPDVGPETTVRRPVPGQPVAEAPVVTTLDASARTDPAPAIQRNPFQFERGSAGGDAPSDPRDLPPAEMLPELPLPIPQPPLRLLGVATEDNVRVAILSVGGDLVFARVGDRLANRFEVAGISADAVDLIDDIGQQPMRLALP